MVGNILRAICAIWLMVTAGAANAEWYEASSDHFLVIADQNEKDVREFAERLERFHSAMLGALNRKEPKPSPSNRVTIYVVRSVDQIGKLAGDKTGFIQGFYQPRAGGSVAFTSRVESGGTALSQSEQTLFHEYAHHVMLGGSDWATPRWMSEGSAEFFSTARFDSKGGVGLGVPALHRETELLLAENVPIEALLDTETYKKRKSKSSTYDEFYGRSWLLYHYLQLSGKRPGQLDKYRLALVNGASELEAASAAFGDLKVLDRELNAYLRSRMNYYDIPKEKLLVGPISVRKMRDGEAAMMPVILESKRGVDDKMAKALLPRVQAMAAKYPSDPAALAALAEAEHDAGNYAAAVAAADKAIAAAPTLVNAHVQKIYALAKSAEGATDSELSWNAVRKAATALNKIEPDHPIPLIYYYRSLRVPGKKITELAALGLERALEIAPYDRSVRSQVSQQLVDEGAYGAAYRTLRPLANNPHNRDEENAAIKLLAEIKQKWEDKLAKEKAGVSQSKADGTAVKTVAK